MEWRRKGNIFLTYLVGVAIFQAVATDQSALATPNDVTEGENTETRQIDTPEVVLQLKYDNGELNKIYLAQFRKPASVWLPSVSDRTVLCSDLCHAGLGGPVCGASCPQMLPVGLKLALNDNNNATSIEYGQPRYGVCPTMCENYLGMPLCKCKTSGDTINRETDWNIVCETFCMDGYLLAGCPSCKSLPPKVSYASSRILGTSEGWSAWCNVQCRQGHGGAACNCDRPPF